MIKNRSVPADILLPHVAYRDVLKAVEWLSRTFKFEEHYRYGDPVSGVMMHCGEGWVMLRAVSEGWSTPAESGVMTQMLTVFVVDVDAHYAHVKAAGAKIPEELHETVYGERQFAAEDLDGHRWLFSRHARDVNPEEWGARLRSR